MENAKDNCIVNIANKHQEKELLEEEFLRLLSETQGSLLENVQVFQALDRSKQSQNDIDETLKINEDLEVKIDLTRESYRLVAQRAAILFFVLQDLTGIDSMYQFSLDGYIQLFHFSIEKSSRSLKLNERIDKLNDYHTYAVYKYGCRVRVATNRPPSPFPCLARASSNVTNFSSPFTSARRFSRPTVD